MLSLFSALALVIILATTLAIFFRFFKQPTILAYLLAGACVGIFGYGEITGNKEAFELFSELGIVFLLFLVGLEINYFTLKSVGKDAALIGIGQVLFTSVLGFGLATLLSFSYVEALYIGFALMLSSTIIVVNTLSEKKELQSVYGKVSLGILLIQDFFALLVLVIQGGFREEGVIGTLAFSLIFAIFKGVLLVFVAFYAGRVYIPKLFNFVARSTDLIFLTSLAWLFMLTWLAQTAGFSKEIGGLVAGITLAHSYERYQIAARLKPLRDFFLLIFFVTLGASLFLFTSFSEIIVPLVIFSLFILIGNPLIVFLLMVFRGFSKRPAFFSGITIAQISEFSLIFVAAGFALGHVDEKIVALITGVGVVTIVVSSYGTAHAERLYKLVSPILSYFERKEVMAFGEIKGGLSKRIVLVGFHRTGQAIAYNLPKEDILIVDFDPDMHTKIICDGFSSLFGDIADLDVRDHIDFKKVAAVISTIPGTVENILFIEELLEIRKKIGNHFKIIIRSRTDDEAKLLYSAGADYVFLPHTTAGRFLARYIASDPHFTSLATLRRDDLAICI